MAGGDWNFYAGRLVGDGTVTDLIGELPMGITQITRSMSAPSAMSGTITNQVKRLRGDDGRLLLEPKNTLIIAEASGYIRGMGIYQKPTFNGADWSISTVGMSGYPQGQPFNGERNDLIDADPLDIFRLIWADLQGQPYGNLGVTMDPLKSPIKVGTPEETVDFETGAGTSVSFEKGPRKLNWYSTFDCGSEIDKYAKATPFDWLEDNYWVGDQPHCHIKLGYPTIGETQEHPRLELGVNLATVPSVSTAEFYNTVLVYGAGEGRDRVRGYASVSDGRIRSVKTIEMTSIDKTADANDYAMEVLNSSRGNYIIDSVEVWGKPDMPLESFELGNRYPIYAETEHVTVDDYARLISRTDSPGGEEKATFTLLREGVA